MADLFKIYDEIVVALRSEDDSAAMKYFHPDFVIHEDPGMPYGGVFKGADKFIELRRKVRAIWNLSFIARCADQDGKTFVAVFRATGVRGGLAESMETVVTVVWTFQDERALEARVLYYDTPRLSAALTNA